MDGNEKTYDATATDVGRVYGVHAKTVRRWAVEGKVPHRMTPSGPRFNLADLDEHFSPEPVGTT